PYLPLATALTPIGGLPILTGDDDGRADERRLQLYVGSANLLAEAARQQPVVLIIDDLHWAEQGTLDLTGHLVSSIAHDGGSATSRVLLVLVTRPVRGGRGAAALLDRVRRLPTARHLAVGGLDHFAMFQLVMSETGERPSRQLLDQLEEASDGNPLLTRSLLERLEAFGSLSVRGGELIQRGSEEILAGRRELDELLRHRIAGVTVPCRELLTIASFLGDDQPVALLQSVAALDAAALDARLQEAADAHLLVEDGDTYHFDHPQLRQLLLHGPRGRRRQELHLRIADSLEQLDPGDPERALTIAHHLRRAGPVVDPDRLVHYSLMAASQASTVVAWGEAARAYDSAIEVTVAREDGPSAFLALLLTRGAYAHWYNHDNNGAIAYAERAAAMAKAISDHRLWALALETLARAIWSSDIGRFGNKVDTAPWEELLDALGDREPSVLARVHYTIASLAFEAADNDRARRHAELGRALLVGSDEPSLAAAIEFTLGLTHLGALELDDASAALARSAVGAGLTDDHLRASSVPSRLAMVHWVGGDLLAAMEEVRDAITRTTPIAAWAEQSVAASIGCGVAAGLGRFDESDRLAEEAQRLLQWAGYVSAAGILFPGLAWSRAIRGDEGGAREALQLWTASGGRGATRLRILIDLLNGVPLSALDAQRTRERPLTGLSPLLDIPTVGTAIEVGDAIDDLQLLDAALARALELLALGARLDMGWSFYLPRLAGTAAMRLDRLDQAAELLDRGWQDAERTGCVVEQAHTAVAQGRLARARGSDPGDWFGHGTSIADRLGLVPLLRAVDVHSH
ncbi:MAG: hypothetical protein QOE63_1978, partial [Acidimicrobiaceae bacterium]